MGVASFVIAFLAAMFAAIAAWGALETVRLTQEMRDEADVPRLQEAIIGMKHALMAMEPGRREARSLWDQSVKLYEAQDELDRAWSAPRLISNREINEMVARLLAARPEQDVVANREIAGRAESAMMGLLPAEADAALVDSPRREVDQATGDSEPKEEGPGRCLGPRRADDASDWITIARWTRQHISIHSSSNPGPSSNTAAIAAISARASSRSRQRPPPPARSQPRA